jgi:hypothetical protein
MAVNLRFLPAFFAATHRFFADSASRFLAAALIGFLLRLGRAGAAPSGVAGPPSLCLSSLILRVISRRLWPKPIRAASRSDLSTGGCSGHKHKLYTARIRSRKPWQSSLIR